MNDPTASGPLARERWISPEATGDADPGAKSAGRELDFCLKNLIGLGVFGMIVGVFVLWLLVNSGVDDWTDFAVVSGWSISVGIGGLLLTQWARFLRGRRLLIASPRLWRVSALFLVYIASLIVWYFAYEENSGGCVHFGVQQAVGFMTALLAFPCTGLVFIATLWCCTSRS